MADTEEEDSVADNLLRQSDPVFGDGLNDAREQFNRDTIVLLLGLGLKGEEVELFQKHEIGLEKFSTLTASDLDYIGIASTEKKQEIMNYIRKMHKQQQKSFPTQEEKAETEYRPEDAQAMDNVLRHQQTLVKIIPYLKRNLHIRCGTTFFQLGISANHTFEKVTLCSVQQATQVHNQLCAYLHDLEQQKNMNQHQKQSPLYRRWPQNHLKWWFFVLIAGSCVSLAVWGSQKGHSFPMYWLKTWRLLSPPNLS